MKRTELRRKTPLRQHTPIRRTEFKSKPPKPDNDFSPKVRAEVERRSGGRCEMRADGHGCTGVATHIHHRKLRRFGDHSAENALHVCPPGHLWIHSHVAESYEMGWLIRGN